MSKYILGFTYYNINNINEYNFLTMKRERTTLLLALIALAVISCSKTQTLQEQLLTGNEKKITEIISGMSLEEKVEMLHSKTIMSSEGIPRLGIQEIRYADGPFGIREEVGNGFRGLGWPLDSATYFPTGSALAATWSAELAYKYGTGMGTEARLRGKDIILGPAINIQRLPVGGRTYEYLSEDPALSSVLATQYTLGAQSKGAAVCLKHYALNNQETNRGSVNVIADERTMREIYLKPFEAAVVEGGAMCVMPAYNKVNGFYCSENDYLNNQILRDEWGFKGMTVSDWGGTHSTMGAALGGLNVQMTGDNYLGKPLIDSVRAGKLDEAIVDNMVRQILRLRFAVEAIPENVANTQMTSQPPQQKIAYEVAQKSIVLLKNNGSLLPLDLGKIKKIAVIGLNATANTAAGGMGAGIKTLYEITPLEGLEDAIGDNAEIVYAKGYKNYAGMFGRWMQGASSASNDIANDIHEAADPKLLAEAVKVAGDADVVLFFAGTNKNIETEGSDRSDIMLPVGQEELAQAIAAVNPNMVTIIVSGGPCDLRVVEKCSPAIVQAWWNGSEGGHALADVLLGKIAPSGKLPMTFPLKLEDSPAYALGNFPQKRAESDIFGSQYRQDITGGAPQRPMAPPAGPDAYYSEGSLVGYRWFDTKGVQVMYPFGHGLSYVNFKYDNIATDKTKYKAKDVIKVSFNIANVGSMEADEVPQLYVRRLDATVEWPYKELKAFNRVTLQSGETKSVELNVHVEDLRYWDELTKGWVLENGKIEILVGSSSSDIRLKTEVEI